ncbi:MAG: hypothetical protein K9N00_06175 [Candidatus Marinimicrobia bacterium]|nr:hypothetical protein [Candidatus Neomarinimicrobiota bacterium]
MSLALILIVAFSGAIITYLAGKVSSKLRKTIAVVFSLALIPMIALLFGKNIETPLFEFLGLRLILRINNLAWIFAIAISILSSLSVIFSLIYMKGKEKVDFYYFMMLFINAAMIGIVFSGDLVSFFIFWEMMSWATFLLISYKRGPALAAGIKYIIMSIFGSMAMLIGILFILNTQGTLIISQLAGNINLSLYNTIFIMILFSVAFGVKNAILPFHAWLPPAHSEAPSPFSAILSGILIKMGTYGFILLLYVIVGVQKLLSLPGFTIVINILATVTIIFPTFVALIQEDAKKLLAWSTVAQAGYIILGIAFGTSLSVTGGIFHFINHATFKALLFLAIGAVEYRTNGVRDLNSLGGLIKQMPITFVAALIGACGLIGVPLTNGFVSKWFIYKSLILNKSPFLAFFALFGTWGTILYSFKLIHNIFLGQTPEKFKSIGRAPFSMQLPMIILSLAVIIFGIFPGLPLKAINSIVVSFGLESLNINLWGLASSTGALNTINIFTAISAGILLVWLLSKLGSKAKSVNQDDTYAAGTSVPQDRYHYTVEFYKPLYRVIRPYLKDIVDIFYTLLADWIKKISSKLRKIYNGYVGNYVMYIILFLAILIFVQLKWSLW